MSKLKKRHQRFALFVDTAKQFCETVSLIIRQKFPARSRGKTSGVQQIGQIGINAELTQLTSSHGLCLEKV